MFTFKIKHLGKSVFNKNLSFTFYRVYHISYKKEVPIMDADMKSFLYFAAFYHPLSDFVPISM